MLDIKIKKTLGNFHLNVSFEVSRGIVGILGPSGCGKSLTLQAIAGLLNPDSGRIIVNGKTLYSEERKIKLPARSRNVGYVFQNYALFPHLTVAENIGYGLKGVPKQERQKKVEAMLETVQLNGLEHRYPKQLSGGQQQRVALARTLVTNPDILLLDEPFSALDQHVKKMLELELLDIIKHHFSGVVLFVTHNIEEAYRLCDYICLYDSGENIQFGRKDEVLQRPINKAAARIVGCENIFEVDLFEGNIAVINGLKMTLTDVPQKDKKYIGIHNYDATFVKDQHLPNTFPFELVSIVEGIDNATITVKVINLFVKVDVSKATAKELTKGEFLLHFPPEKLF